MSIRSLALAALFVPVALVACGPTPSDSTDVQVAGDAVRALGVVAYDRFSDAPLGALLLDADGEVRGETFRTGDGASPGFELVDADGRRIEVSLGDAPWLEIDGRPAAFSEEDRGIALLRAVALDPAFHALDEAASGGDSALGEAKAALRFYQAAGTSDARSTCYAQCGANLLSCLDGGTPALCNAVYDTCVSVCSIAHPSRVRSAW